MTRGFVEELMARAAGSGAVVVYPEPEDGRVVGAAGRVAAEGLARPVLVGAAESMPPDLPQGVDAEAIEEAGRLDGFAADYSRRRGLGEPVARRLVSKPLVYGAMMVSGGIADGMVCGVSHTTASVLRAVGLAVGYREGFRRASSCLIMLVRGLRGHEEAPLIFADCAVNIEPSAEELAATAVAAADAARRFLRVVPRVAMLSFSTHGSAAHASVDLVREATELAAARIGDGFVDGELQLDAAVSPEIARRKMEDPGDVAGRANVLIFPDLNAGNIAYKAVQYLGGARAIGPILIGLRRPVNDLSRGASVDDIVAVTALTVLQA